MLSYAIHTEIEKCLFNRSYNVAAYIIYYQTKYIILALCLAQVMIACWETSIRNVLYVLKLRFVELLFKLGACGFIKGLIITRVSEVIMFSPCVFVCLCLYHDVCPDDLPMKDWCNTNNILQVHCWGCLVVQVMFHALMTSSMTSPGHKVGQILKVIYLRQYLS